MSATKILNFNVGLLGHVDSGKTSLARVLSTVSSTAAFDKDPQSQERGITLDLGFSSFSCPIPQHLSDSSFETIQYTLVDCPGHASLIKTIIGGSQIIDLMLLIIDVTKGFQTQTSECLIIGEITRKKLIVVLNKVDLLTDENEFKKLKKKVKLTLDNTVFKGSPIVPASALSSNVRELTDMLKSVTFIPERSKEKPFLFAIDHCFALKGKGTVLTGTVLQGKAEINSDIEIPSISMIRKIKSIEIFKKPVNSVMQGDRAGVCVTQFDPKILERGLACDLGYLPKVYAAIIDFNKVKYYKGDIKSKSVFHINVGYENVTVSSKVFDFDKEYTYVASVGEDSSRGEMQGKALYVLIEFSKAVLVAPNSLTIGARLDGPVHSNSCRLAFYGRVLSQTSLKNYHTSYLKALKICKEKRKTGIVDRVINEHELIGKNMFKKESNMEKFMGMKVSLSSGECGIIESTFGQSGKFKVRIPDGLIKTENGKKSAEKKFTTPVEIFLTHKTYIYDPNKSLFQT